MQATGWTGGDLVRATVASHAAQILSIIVAILLTPIVYGRLGAESYGLWLVLLSQVSLLGLLDPDLHDSVLRNVTVLRADGDHRLAGSIVANALLLAMLIGGIGALLVATLSGFFLDEFAALDDHHRAAQVLLAAAAILFCCEQLTSVPEAVLLSAKRYMASEIAGILSQLVGAAVTVAVLWSGGGLVGLAIATGVNAIFRMVMVYLVARRYVPDLPISLRNARRDGATWRPLFSFLAWSTIIGMAMAAIHDSDTLLLGASASVGAVAAFSLALRIPMTLWSITETTFWTVFPYAADLHGRARADLLRRTLLVGTKLATAISVLFLVAAWFVGPLVLMLWVGRVEQGTTLLRLGLVANVIWAGFLVAELLLYGCSQLRPLAVIYGVGAIIGLPATVLLIIEYQAVGAVVGTMVIGVVLLVLTLLRAARFLDQSVWPLLRMAILVPLAPLPPALALMTIVDRAMSGNPVAQVGAAMVTGAVYVVITAMTVFTPRDRIMAIEWAGAWIAGTRAVVNGRRRRQAP